MVGPVISQAEILLERPILYVALVFQHNNALELSNYQYLKGKPLCAVMDLFWFYSTVLFYYEYPYR